MPNQDASILAINQKWEKVEFPLTEKELATFYQMLNTLDFEYFEHCLNGTCVRKEDVEKIAVVKHCLDQFNDVIASRLDWLTDDCGVILPTGDALDKILDRYHAL